MSRLVHPTLPRTPPAPAMREVRRQRYQVEGNVIAATYRTQVWSETEDPTAIAKKIAGQKVIVCDYPMAGL